MVMKVRISIAKPAVAAFALVGALLAAAPATVADIVASAAGRAPGSAGHAPAAVPLRRINQPGLEVPAPELTQPRAEPMSDDVDQLLARLKDPAETDWKSVENRIRSLWSQSGSPSMDLLLERGRDALDAGDARAAIEHLTALTDHAPEFAEGWNARATAFYLAGEFGLAIADIERALALEPRNFSALAGLGIVLEELGYERKAMEAYRAALAIHPRRPDLKEAVERLAPRVDGIEI